MITCAPLMALKVVQPHRSQGEASTQVSLFFIASLERSASSTLVRNLGMHPKISMYGELLHHEDADRPEWLNKRFPTRDAIFVDFPAFLSVFRANCTLTPGSEMCGFKLFPGHVSALSDLKQLFRWCPIPPHSPTQCIPHPPHCPSH